MTKEEYLNNLNKTETAMLAKLIKKMKKDKEDYKNSSLCEKIIQNAKGLYELFNIYFIYSDTKKNQIKQLKKLY